MMDGFLSPLRGFSFHPDPFPRLSPWATFCRRSAANFAALNGS
jgi:hypothetical protein